MKKIVMTSNTNLFELHVKGRTCLFRHVSNFVRVFRVIMLESYQVRFFFAYSAAAGAASAGAASAGAASTALTSTAGASVTTAKEYLGFGL